MKTSIDLETHSQERHDNGGTMDVSSLSLFLSPTLNCPSHTWTETQALIDNPNFDPAAIRPKN
jgi:hypothetical protein